MAWMILLSATFYSGSFVIGHTVLRSPRRQDISNPGFPLTYANAVYMSAMLLTTIGEGGHGPVPVSAFARCAAAGAVLIFLPLVAIRVSTECSLGFEHVGGHRTGEGGAWKLM